MGYLRRIIKNWWPGDSKRSAQRRLELALQASDLGVWEYDLVRQSLTCDDKMLGIYGLERSELKDGYAVWEACLHPDDIEKATRPVWESLEKSGEFEVEFRIRRKDGSIRYIRSLGRSVANAAGKPVRLIGTNCDITRQKEQEAALRESESRFKNILRNVKTVAVQGYTLEGTVVYWNHASELFYGYTEAEAIGGNLLDLIIPGPMRPAVREEMRQMAATGKAIPSSELRLQRKDGSRIDVFSSHALVEVPGKQSELFCIDVDLTELKKTERYLEDLNRQLGEETARSQELARMAQKASRAKSQFLANMSHEIRTPMNGIIGMLDLLLDSDLSDSQREEAATAKASADSLLYLLSDILDISRIEAGKLELTHVPFELPPLLHELIGSLQARADEKQLALSCETDAQLPHDVEGDPRRLRQILYNLVGNAIKFTDTGSVRLEALLGERKEDSNTAVLEFRIRDTGIGIAEDKQAVIFNRFEQLDSTDTRRHGGSGLGLAIVQQLTEMMGGAVGLQSEEGKGSCFTVTIAVRLPDPSGGPLEERETAAADEPEGNSGPLPPCRVLLVEDNAVNQVVVQKMLARGGLTADVVSTGEAAVQAFEQSSYDIVLMDIRMPGMDGLETSRQLRMMEQQADRPPNPKPVPIIALTAHAMEGDRSNCLAAGMTDYLAKPVYYAELVAMIRKWAGT